MIKSKKFKDFNNKEKNEFYEFAMKILNNLSLEQKEDYLLSNKNIARLLPNEYLFELMLKTRNKYVCKLCLENISAEFSLSLAENEETERDVILRLTMCPSSIVLSTILKRQDLDKEILFGILENDESDAFNEKIINNELMDEETLYKATDIKNNIVLSQILLSNKASDRIIKKLQKSEDEEIKTMAKVIDPATSKDYITKTIKNEMKQAIDVKDDYCTIRKNTKSLLLTDITEAALKNPKLSTEALELYTFCTKTIVTNYVIPHKNIGQKQLEFYIAFGEEEAKKAAFKRRQEIEFSDKNK